MIALRYRTYETVLGWAGIAWQGRGIARLALPDADRGRVRRSLRGRAADLREAEPPAEIAAATRAIAALFEGELDDLRSIALEMGAIERFDREVYEAARRIGPGTTVTYGELAARVGAPREARAVGAAMARNPFPPVVPCHRVVASDGGLGGFSAPGGVEAKRRLLAIEGAVQPSLFDAVR